MIKLEEVKHFIENMYGLKLFDYQLVMLQAMLEGRKYSAPRKCGRTMLLNGYQKYLEDKFAKHTAVEDAEVQISRGLRSKLNVIDDTCAFDKEYVCEWYGKLKE